MGRHSAVVILSKLTSLATGIVLTACSVVGIRSGTEQPAYTVTQSIGPDFQIRHYDARVAAETVVVGSETAARGEGFRRLAGYIFGANHTAATIAMTAPVATAQTIAMTAPVAVAQTAQGWRIAFFMPSKYTLATLPAPNDDRVHLVVVPAETYGVYRYSGAIAPADTARAHATLLGLLQQAGYKADGPIMDWFYDPPWTLPPLRRNEAAAMVRKAE
jgi:hypothetical protein